MESARNFWNEANFTPYLQEDEKIRALGTFRKIPSVPAMMMTRGLARFFSKKSLVAVTDKRLILFPISGPKSQTVESPTASVGFDDVRFHDNWIYSTVMEVYLPGEEIPLRLRFSGQMRSLGLDKFNFLGAVYQGRV